MAPSLPARVHPLKNQQQRIAVGGVVQLLQRAQCLNVFFQELFDTASSTCKHGFTFVGHSLSLTLAPGRTRKSFDLIFIYILSAVSATWFAPAYFLVSTSGVFCFA